MNYVIREMPPSDYPLLEVFLYLAIFVPEGMVPPPRDVIRHPDLQVYICGFGQSVHDTAFAAYADGKAVGAVWCRIMQDYGHIDSETPSLAISLLPDYRGRGIGKALMQAMLAALKKKGYPSVSLSVQKENDAVKLYRALDFRVLKESGGEYIMLRALQ